MDSRAAALLWLGLLGLLVASIGGDAPGESAVVPPEPVAASDPVPDPVAEVAPPPAGPILLVYGFQPLPGFHAPRLWEEVIDALAGPDHVDPERREVGSDHELYVVPREDGSTRALYVSDYALAFEPTVRDLRFYAERLAAEIRWIRAAEGADEVDLVAFSMGALVARTYIEADDLRSPTTGTGDEVFELEYRGDVRTLITMAAPHHGAAFAALGPWFGPLATQLDPSSPYLEALNDGESTGTALHPDVRYVSLAGQCCLGFGCSVRSDADACRRECAEEALAWSGHDLVVMMSSARLAGAENVACVGFDHVEMHTHPVIIETLVHLLDGNTAPAAVFATEELRAAVEP